jgi:hypothetical protein
LPKKIAEYLCKKLPFFANFFDENISAIMTGPDSEGGR